MNQSWTNQTEPPKAHEPVMNQPNWTTHNLTLMNQPNQNHAHGLLLHAQLKKPFSACLLLALVLKLLMFFYFHREQGCQGCRQQLWQ